MRVPLSNINPFNRKNDSSTETDEEIKFKNWDEEIRVVKVDLGKFNGGERYYLQRRCNFLGFSYWKYIKYSYVMNIWFKEPRGFYTRDAFEDSPTFLSMRGKFYSKNASTAQDAANMIVEYLSFKRNKNKKKIEVISHVRG